MGIYGEAARLLANERFPWRRSVPSVPAARFVVCGRRRLGKERGYFPDSIPYFCFLSFYIRHLSMSIPSPSRLLFPYSLWDYIVDVASSPDATTFFFLFFYSLFFIWTGGSTLRATSAKNNSPKNNIFGVRIFFYRLVGSAWPVTVVLVFFFFLSCGTPFLGCFCSLRVGAPLEIK